MSSILEIQIFISISQLWIPSWRPKASTSKLLPHCFLPCPSHAWRQKHSLHIDMLETCESSYIPFFQPPLPIDFQAHHLSNRGCLNTCHFFTAWFTSSFHTGKTLVLQNLLLPLSPSSASNPKFILHNAARVPIYKYKFDLILPAVKDFSGSSLSKDKA